jgi:hypothetical protein
VSLALPAAGKLRLTPLVLPVATTPRLRPTSLFD